jgi:hypothetical protein
VPDPYPIDPQPTPTDDCITTRGNLIRLWIRRKDSGRDLFQRFRNLAVSICADKNNLLQLVNAGPLPYYLSPGCQPMLELTCDRGWLLLKFYRSLLTRLEDAVDAALNAIDCTASDWQAKIKAVEEAMQAYQQAIWSLGTDLTELESSLVSCQTLCSAYYRAKIEPAPVGPPSPPVPVEAPAPCACQ